MKWLKENNQLYYHCDVNKSIAMIEAYVENNIHYEHATAGEIATEIISTYHEAINHSDNVAELIDQKILDTVDVSDRNTIPVEQLSFLADDDVSNEAVEEPNANTYDNQSELFHVDYVWDHEQDFINDVRAVINNQRDDLRICRSNTNDISDHTESDEGNELSVEEYFDESDSNAVRKMPEVSAKKAEKYLMRVRGNASKDTTRPITSCNTEGHLLTVDGNYDSKMEFTEPLRLHQYSVTALHKENLKESDTEIWKLNRNQGIR